MASLGFMYMLSFILLLQFSNGDKTFMTNVIQFMQDVEDEMRQNFTAMVAQCAARFEELGLGNDHVPLGRAAPRGPQQNQPFNRVLKPRAPQGNSQAFSLLARYQAYLLNQLKNKFTMLLEDIKNLYEALLEVYSRPPPAEIFVPDVPMQVFDVSTCPYPNASDSAICNPLRRYRTFDGSCNNLRNPLWGRSLTPLARFLQPDYADGIDQPRVSLLGNPLPSARLVGINMFEELNITSPAHTVITMLVGQITDHDMGLTAISTLSMNISGVGETVEVKCGDSGCETSGPENEACFPIPVDPEDPFFGGQECLTFVRSQEAPAASCNLGPRQQLNLNTAYLDASMVYGSSLEQAIQLRDLTDPARGRMNVTDNERSTLKPLLPQIEDTPECGRLAPEPIKCFKAGDSRVNEQVGLTAMHTIFVRYHNYIEEELHRNNPHWDGETLYQETRRIVIAVWQYLVYKEFIPVVVGPRYARYFNLSVDNQNDYTGYNDSVQAEMANAFQTAAFRFGHTLIPTTLHVSSYSYTDKESSFISQNFEHPAELYNNDGPANSGLDSLMMGLVAQPCPKADPVFSDQVTRHLFTHDPPYGIGTDLSALNIQRGRDHGLPGYVHWRKWCGLSVPNNFDELEDIPVTKRSTLQSLYSYVEDIDLFPGGIAETPISAGLVGPTFACIISKQFQILRVGDRFWFERQGVATAFSAAQIREIRRMTLARIMCNTLDHVDTIQKHVLLQPIEVMRENIGNRFDELYDYELLYTGNGNNTRRSCSELPDLDLTKWTESQ